MKDWNSWWARFTVTSIMLILIESGVFLGMYNDYDPTTVRLLGIGLLLLSILLSMFVATMWHIIDNSRCNDEEDDDKTE